MAADDFNPYYVWLGLGRQLTRPSYYQLLGLSETETDVQRIAAAADWAASRVRSCIPGPYATLWTTVLDEISAAKRCLTDLVERAIYDRQLRQQRIAKAPPRQRPATPAPSIPQVPLGSPASMTSVGGGPSSYPTPLMPPAHFLGTVHAVTYPDGPPTHHPAPMPACGHMLSPTMPTAPGVTPPGAIPQRTPFSNLLPSVLWPAAPGAPSNRLLPSSGPLAATATLATAMPAAALVEEATEAVTVESELAAAIAPTAKRRAAAIRAKKEESRAKVIAVLVMACGGGVLLVAVAILALASSRLGHTSENHSQAGGKHPATPPAQTTSVTVPKLGAANQDPPKRGVTAKQPLPGKLDRRSRLPNSGERRPGPGRSSKTAEEDTILPLSGIEELAPKSEAEMQPPWSLPAGNQPNVYAPAAKPKPAPSAVHSVHEFEKRGSSPQPTPAEVRTLAVSLKKTRDALSDYRFDLAKSELEKVNGLPMRPEHREKHQRLDVLTQHAEKFYTALSDAVNGLTAGTNIRMASGAELGVVSVAENNLTVRVAAKNWTYPLSALPPALALAIADQFIVQQGDGAPAFKAAYLITHKNATDVQLTKAREWWKSAKTYGGQVANLEQVVDDRYDLEEDLKK